MRDGETGVGRAALENACLSRKAESAFLVFLCSLSWEGAWACRSLHTVQFHELYSGP